MRPNGRAKAGFLFGLTTPKGPVGMPMADALGKITKFVKEPQKSTQVPKNFQPGDEFVASRSVIPI
jgi:hypothetical protein